MYHLMVETPLKEKEYEIGVIPDDLELCRSVMVDIKNDLSDEIALHTRKKYVKRDYTLIAGVPEARLCSERFIQILKELNVPYRSYHARITNMDKKKKASDQNLFVLVPQTKVEVINWEQSEVYWMNTNRRRLTKVALNSSIDEMKDLLFYSKELINCYIVHDKVKTRLEAAQLQGVGFAPLDAVANPLAGVERLEVEKELQVKPDDVSLLLRLSVLYTSTFRVQDALIITQRVLSIEPENCDAIHACGAHLYNLGRLEEALSMYSREVEIDQSRRGWWECCMILRQLGRVDEALALCKKYLFQEPWITSRRSWYELGVSYAAVGNAQDALDALEHALKFPGEPRDKIYGAKGSLLLALHRYEEALDVYNQGLKISSFDIELWRGKLEALIALNKEEQNEEREYVKMEVLRMEENQKLNLNLW